MGKKNQNDYSSIMERISELENRISILEKSIVISNKSKITEYENNLYELSETKTEIGKDAEEKSLESHIGVYGLAWLGNIVLLFCGIFLHLFIQGKGMPMLSAIIGYSFVGSMLFISHKMLKSFAYLSGLFRIFAQILLFYVTASLHFFFENVLISNAYFALSLLIIVVVYQIYQAWKLSIEKFAILGLCFLVITAIIGNQSSIFLFLLLAASALSVFLLFKFGWTRLLLLSLFMVYLSFLIWFLGNPIMNSGINVVKDSQWSEYYLLACAAIFSLIFIFKNPEKYSKGAVFSILIFNGLGFSFIISLMVVSFFKDSYGTLFAFISMFCILYSVLLKRYSPWKYAPALYAVYGFVTISITFYGIFDIPMIFLTLSLQSLLVLSMALWFRSKIIVVMNTLMFVTVALVYYFSFESVDIINFSFPIVAIASARIINWQQNRLTLKTQFIRNIYLFILFFSLLYSLKKGLPGEYVTLSWALSATLFFGLSILLKLVKYRYLAIGTLLAASIYLIFVDLATIDLLYRILAFLLLAIISIGISVYYVEISRQKKQVLEESDNLNNDPNE